jgi:anti-sigma regulatory factor (Ser/Thr protein kinase)
MDRRFRRSFEALDELDRAVHGFFETRALDLTHRDEVQLVIEELVTNMVKYAPDGAPEIRLELAVADDTLTITLTDVDVEPFDIRDAPRPPLDRPVNERRPGGLGLHLVRELMDGIDYHYADRRSTTTLTKRLR